MQAGSLVDPQPNVLLITTHDQGRYLGCYGADVETPALDGLAADGVRFTDAVCPAPQCSPSRGSLMTGKYPHRNGLMGLAHLGWEIDPGERTLPTALGEAGYDTHLFGLQHESSDPATLGYDECHVENERAGPVSETVASFLEEHGSGPDAPERPFFASVGTKEPHRLGRQRAWGFDHPRYDADDPEDVTVPDGVPDVPAVREELGAFNGMVRAVDSAVEGILDALETAGIADETLVVFTTDHGIAFPRAKGTLHEAGIETALLMRHPDLPSGESVDALVGNVDLHATLCALAGATPADDIDGRSLVPVLGGEQAGVRDRLFLELTYHDRYNPVRGVRTDRYKYVRSFDDLPEVYLPHDVLQSKSGRALYERYYTDLRPGERLYDLDTDPHERTNLVDDPDHQAVAERLRGEVDTWMHRTDDPLLEGDVPMPEEHAAQLRMP